MLDFAYVIILYSYCLSMQMESCPQVSGTKLYAITCDPLPSHIRTIFLATEKYKTEYPIYKKSILTKLSTTPTRRAVILTAITLLFCIAITSLAVSVAIEISRKQPAQLEVEERPQVIKCFDQISLFFYRYFA